ncbi:YdcF family protein [uncultured Amnibacterium sp.]|uniref:YdcF family protein n=1 Tax=uncultured Amnibacterium sp. TaxID=1631851 RepID=UPI0035CC3D4A
MLLRTASALLVAACAWRAVTIGQRTRRVVRRIGVAALGGLVVWGLLGLVFFVSPAVDAMPEHADVLLVLGPPLPQRVAVAERLLTDGTVGAALVSVPYDSIPPEIAALCARPDVICADPDPRTTRGEARMLRRYAVERGWTSAVVTTMPAHIARARSIVRRCFSGTLSMVSDTEGPSGGWPYQYAYQTAATVKSWLLPGC